MSRTTDLFKGLMFLQGHFTRPEDLDPGRAALGNRAASGRWFARKAGAGAAARTPAATPKLGVLAHLQLLGGRPMHAGHNLDVGEPFELQTARGPGPAANQDARPDQHAACG